MQSCSVKHVSPFLPHKFGCMHVKLGILVYQDFVRVYVGSANLLGFDWSGIQNVVYVHDFPKLKQHRVDDTSFYHAQLAPLLTDLNVPKGVHGFLSGYDYSTFKNGQLITSRPGSFHPTEIQAYGLSGLVRAAQKLKWPDNLRDKALTVTASTSSVGLLTADYVTTWAAVARGLERISRTQFPEMDLRLVFPTMNEVLNNVYGVQGGGTCCFQPAVWENPKFPHQVLHTLSSNAPGYLSHCKTITILPSDATLLNNTPSETPIGMYYAGSHNFTKSAWGSFAKTSGKVYMNNYEAGLIFPIMKMSDLDTKFPVPYTEPKPYFHSRSPDKNDQIPWMQDLFQ